MTLRDGSIDDINQMFSRTQQQRRDIIEEIIRLVYFMRGSVQYKDMMDMTLIERQSVGEFISKRLEAESKKMYQNY